MVTPTTVNSLELVDTCVGISIWKWDEYMKDTTKANKNTINKLVKIHCPDIYDSLGLDYYNPYDYYKKEGLLVLVHSLAEHFFKYD